MKTRSQVFLALTIVILSAVTLAAFSLRGGSEVPANQDMEGHDHSAMSAGSDEAQPVSLSADAAARIGVTYATVVTGSLPRTVNTVGFVTYDETRLSSVSPKIKGWVERLFVDFTGANVRAGQPLMEVYSPELVTAQEELLLAKGLLEEAQAGGGDRAMKSADELLTAARRRLAYWDIPEAEIQALEDRGTVAKTLTLRAPASGVVVEKNVVVGARIAPGMDLFQLADLGRVWVDAEVFEKDISIVGEGQHAMVSFEGYPGEMFHGSVTYIYPTVSASSRTGRVRLELPNPGLKLKPGMYAQVELHGGNMEETLLVPRSAVLQTGERSVVFHRMSNGQLHPMEVVTGLSSGDQIQVLSGLREGHVVAASATFLIDAESNLGAAMAAMAGMDHSMMDMGGEPAGDEGMDHSQHQMGDPPADTTGAEMDHSGHVMPPDTAGSR
ncbi:MAG: efflux RND transporter periplasmic adaptor subunit [Gemmatimonadetes bacterium]|nr:efflux RND transporter periplasmic adaptor subunit [Gemmatimonadota bacterium]NNM06837.1 efflux RND transporter periplasmic adaptor subunit [Gemmatimonadota bacterium]